METIGLDLRKREGQLCIGRDDGTVEERRMVTSRERFTAVLEGRSRARILLEASTESEWVLRHLESLGHEAIVAVRCRLQRVSATLEACRCKIRHPSFS